MRLDWIALILTYVLAFNTIVGAYLRVRGAGGHGVGGGAYRCLNRIIADPYGESLNHSGVEVTLLVQYWNGSYRQRSWGKAAPVLSSYVIFINGTTLVYLAVLAETEC